MKKRFTYLGTLVAMLLFFTAAAQPDSVRIYLDSSLTILRQNALYGKKVNWKSVEKQVYAKAKTAQSRKETFGALQIAFDALGDKHAAYYQYEDSYKLENKALMARYSDSIREAWKRSPKIYGRLLDDVAFVNIPFLGVNKQKDIDAFANRINQVVADLSVQNPKGWIVDLRLNGGGNIRPMLAGLAAFFPEGVVGYYVDRDGVATDEAAFRNGDFLISGAVQAVLERKISGLEGVKVAVLVGPGTASSGEGTAAAFQSRPHTQLFGEKTAGVANATNGFVFNHGQSYFLISTAYLGDKHKKALPEYLTPQNLVAGNDAFHDLRHDLVVQAAVQWLKK